MHILRARIGHLISERSYAIREQLYTHFDPSSFLTHYCTYFIVCIYLDIVVDICIYAPIVLTQKQSSTSTTPRRSTMKNRHLNVDELTHIVSRSMRQQPHLLVLACE